jgi:hypothetical protein
MDPLSGRNIDLDFDWSVEESVAAVVEVAKISYNVTLFEVGFIQNSGLFRV